MDLKNTAVAVGKRRRFTLMELMIVLVILGLLMALVTPQFIGKAEQAKRSTARMQIEFLGNALNDYYLDVGEYPSSLQALITNPGSDRWAGPYLDPPRIPKDPWDEDYHYRYPGEHGRFDIFSYGANRAPGGEGPAADIVSWE